MRRYFTLGLLGLLAVIGVACAGEDEATPTPTPTLAPTVTATPT